MVTSLRIPPSNCNCSRVLDFHLIKFSINHSLLDSLECQVPMILSPSAAHESIMNNIITMTPPPTPHPATRPVPPPLEFICSPSTISSSQLLVSTASKRATSTHLHKIALRNVPPQLLLGKGPVPQLVRMSSCSHPWLMGRRISVCLSNLVSFRNQTALLEHA